MEMTAQPGRNDKDRAPVVLFYKQLGDLVLLQPALARLARFHGRPVVVQTHPAFGPVLEMMGRETVIAEKADPYGDLYVFERGSKVAWKAFFTKTSNKQLLLSKEDEKKWFHPLVFDRVVVDAASREYRALYYWKHVAGRGEESFRAPRLQVPPVEWEGKYSSLGNHVLIHPTSAWKRKCWTVAQWHQSLAALQDAGVESFVVTSGPDAWEVEHAREIAAGLPAHTRCLAGQTTLRELISLVQRSRLVLAVDGAVAHLAAALEKPSIALFGPAHPLHWHWATDINRVLSARDYSGEQRPPASHIPAQDLVAAATGLYFREPAS